MPSFINISGKKYGRLTVVSKASDLGDERIRWNTKCDCGQDFLTRGDLLKSGNTRSCGCLHEEYAKERSIIGTVKLTHGASGTPEHRAYKAAKNRTTNAHPRYDRWCGRGIKFRFENFEGFIAEIGLRPSPKHSLDRWPDNDGHYEPGNIRWATAKEQANNRRKRKSK